MNKSRVQQIKQKLFQLADTKKAQQVAKYFKTGEGEYGEGDIFLGIYTKPLRQIANQYQDLALFQVSQLLTSSIHEHRIVALLILIQQFQKHKSKQRQIYELYLENISHINNWDLVDLSAPTILGPFLEDKEEDKDMIYSFAFSDNLWLKRISMLTTLYYIKKSQFSDALAIANILVNDQEDLIHKAVGWMLREIGKKNIKIEEQFLKKHAPTMPRVMLRYAIEKFSPSRRKYYLNLKNKS